MGRVAVQATVAVGLAQMTVRSKHLLPHIRMTLQTVLHSQADGPVMAGTAPILEGLMYNISNQSGPLTAVGIMTGKTILELAGKARMPLFQPGVLMAGQTKMVTLVCKQLKIIRLMGTMTAHAPSLCIRFMGHLVLLRQFFMAGKTVCGRIITNKTLSAPHMRSMTGTALAPGNRIMDNSL